LVPTCKVISENSDKIELKQQPPNARKQILVDFVRQAQPPLEHIPSSLNSFVLWGVQTLLPFWLKLKTNISAIEATQVEDLARLYHQFQTGKIRLCMAFRHPNSNDPLCIAYLLWQLLPKAAKQQGIPLLSPIHSHFIYDRGIPLWAGSWVGWLYSNLGGTSIHRGKIDLLGLRSARNLFARSNLPMAAAPEGATNGHNEIVSILEPGIAQLGFWCVEDLLKEGRSEEVLIIPIGIQYSYVTPPWESLEKILTQLEIDTGITAQTKQIALSKFKWKYPKDLDATQIELYQRLYKLGEHLLSSMENFYAEFYHQSVPEVLDTHSDPNTVLSTRLQNLLNVALQVAEQYFDLKPKGNLIDRCRRLEQAGWDCIYLPEFKKPKRAISNLERGLADLVAQEASLRMWHMRLVETFVSVTGFYVKENPTAERFAETTLLLWDLVSRIKGENPFRRPNLGKQQVRLKVGEPISVSDRWRDYQLSRRQAVTQLTQDLQIALERMITKND
jgi:1-acyl-sn-glycerol-3-phosphate acyltransferase